MSSTRWGDPSERAGCPSALCRKVRRDTLVSIPGSQSKRRIPQTTAKGGSGASRVVDDIVNRAALLAPPQRSPLRGTAEAGPVQRINLAPSRAAEAGPVQEINLALGRAAAPGSSFSVTDWPDPGQRWPAAIRPSAGQAFARAGLNRLGPIKKPGATLG